MTETEILNAEDDWEDDFGQNTSDSNDPLRPVDLCYDVTLFLLLVYAYIYIYIYTHLTCTYDTMAGMYAT